MLWSAVRKTSKPAASAASSSYPFFSRSHPCDLHSFTAWPRKEEAIPLAMQLSSKTRIQKLLTGTSRLRAANSRIALISSRETGNCSMIWSTVIPCSRFSKTTETGVRVPLNNQAPLTLPGILSTAGHCDQSKACCIHLPFGAISLLCSTTEPGMPSRKFRLIQQTLMAREEASARLCSQLCRGRGR